MYRNDVIQKSLCYEVNFSCHPSHRQTWTDRSTKIQIKETATDYIFPKGKESRVNNSTYLCREKAKTIQNKEKNHFNFAYPY